MTEETSPLTYNERRGVVARYFGFSAGWENDVDDPEAGGVMKPQQNHCEQRPAHATRWPHLLCLAAAAAPLGASWAAADDEGATNTERGHSHRDEPQADFLPYAMVHAWFTLKIRVKLL